MSIDYPRTSCFHSAEHLISLFLGDICKMRPIQLLMKFYRQVYSFLGGSRHQLYAVFKKYTKAANTLSDTALILMKLCGLRMGGIFYCFLRQCRVKQSILDVICCTEAIDAKVPIAMKRILQDDAYWQVKVALLRFIAPVLHLLRVSDRKQPGMDKLKYFSGRMVQYMVDNASEINELFGCTSPNNPEYSTSIWRKLDDYLNSKDAEEAIPDQEAKTPSTQADSDEDSVTSETTGSEEDSVGDLEEDDGLQVQPVPPPPHRHLCGRCFGALEQEEALPRTLLCHCWLVPLPCSTHHGGCQNQPLPQR